jgi:hypothetical protein
VENGMGYPVIVFVFSLLMLSNVSALADDAVRLNSVALKENGRQEDAGMVMNIPRTCTFNSYRYEIDLHGQLFFKESATCQGNDGRQLGSTDETLLVCQLDTALHCNSKMKRFPDVSFGAGERGVSVNDAITPWENSQQAAQLLPAIKLGAERNTKALDALNKSVEANLCPLLFGRFLIQFKRDGQIASDGNSGLALKTCTPKFQDICGDTQSKAQLVAMAVASKQNSDINSQDIDNFCATIKSQ